MGRGTKWTSDERTVVCYAWINATNDSIHGKDQTGEDFWKKVHNNVKQMKPAGFEEGTYASRGHEAIKVFLKKGIFPDVNKFNVSLRSIRSSKPTGCTENEIISMAVAVHMKMTKSRDYDFKKLDPLKWPNYSSWRALKDNPKFRDVVVLNSKKTMVVIDNHQNENEMASAISPNLSYPNETNSHGIDHQLPVDVSNDIDTNGDLKMPAVETLNSICNVLSGQRKAKREQILEAQREKKQKSMNSFELSMRACADELKTYNEAIKIQNERSSLALKVAALKEIINMTQKGAPFEDSLKNFNAQKNLMKRMDATAASVLDSALELESASESDCLDKENSDNRGSITATEPTTMLTFI
jgi:hypothetical protein